MRLILNTFYSTQNKCLSNAICSYLRDNLPKHYACLYWHVQTLVEFYENVSEYQRENLLEQEIKRIKIWNDIKISNILLMALAISMPIYHATRLHSVLRKTPIHIVVSRVSMLLMISIYDISNIAEYYVIHKCVEHNRFIFQRRYSAISPRLLVKKKSHNVMERIKRRRMESNK